MYKRSYNFTLLLFATFINYFSFINFSLATTKSSIDFSVHNNNQSNIQSQTKLKQINNLSAQPNLVASIYGKDDRIVVSNTTETPWDNIAKLKIQFPDGQKFIGSGAAIDSTHIITAAHNVFLKGHGGQAELNSISVSFEKYGTAKVSKIRILEGWTTDKNWKLNNNQWLPISHKDDMALLTLDRPLENFTKSFDCQSNLSSFSLKTTINISGYPDNYKISSKNLVMKNAAGIISFAEDSQLFYNQTLDTQGGQSGSPVWYFDSDTKTYKIIGIHVEGNKWIKGDFYNVATQITNEKLKLLFNWIEKDTNSYKYK